MRISFNIKQNHVLPPHSELTVVAVNGDKQIAERIKKAIDKEFEYDTDIVIE
jgi:hypothetical protein